MPYLAICRRCDWEQGTLNREQAEHAKRVHEAERGHEVEIREIEAE